MSSDTQLADLRLVGYEQRSLLQEVVNQLTVMLAQVPAPIVVPSPTVNVEPAQITVQPTQVSVDLLPLYELNLQHNRSVEHMLADLKEIIANPAPPKQNAIMFGGGPKRIQLENTEGTVNNWDDDGGLRVHLQNPSDGSGAVGLTDTELRAAAVPISGTITANLGTIDGAATEATLAYQKNKFQPGIRTTQAATFNTVGDNVVYTPASGKKLRVYWVGMSSSQNNGSENKVIVKFAPGGTAKYIWRMGNPGAFSHWEPIEGAVNEALILNLTTVDVIDVNYTLEEI